MLHYSCVSIVDFEQVNIGWGLPGSFQKLESRKNLEKSHAWPFKRLSSTRKVFRWGHWIVPKLKHLSLKQRIIRIWYFLWLLLLFDTQLKQVLQIYTNKSFSSSSYSCLAMKVCESEVYKHVVQPLEMHCACCFSEKLESLRNLSLT